MPRPIPQHIALRLIRASRMRASLPPRKLLRVIGFVKHGHMHPPPRGPRFAHALHLIVAARAMRGQAPIRVLRQVRAARAAARASRLAAVGSGRAVWRQRRKPGGAHFHHHGMHGGFG